MKLFQIFFTFHSKKLKKLLSTPITNFFLCFPFKHTARKFSSLSSHPFPCFVQLFSLEIFLFSCDEHAQLANSATSLSKVNGEPKQNLRHDITRQCTCHINKILFLLNYLLNDPYVRAL